MRAENKFLEEYPEYYRVLRRAWRVHSQILPYNRTVTFGDYEIYSWIVFANTLGGDHRSFIEFAKRYNLEKIAEQSGSRNNNNKILEYKNRLGIFIADVSGHSFEDILLVHNLHSSLFTSIPYELEMNCFVSSQLFCNLNNRIFNSTPQSKFISAIYAELLMDGGIRFLIAGHPPPLVFDISKKKFLDIKFSAGVPLGLFPSRGSIDLDPDKQKSGKKVSFHFNNICLPSQSVIVLYTDGVVEIENLDGEPFGLENLKEVICAHQDKKAKELFRQILIATNRHRGRNNNAPLDDRTMVVIKCCRK